MANVELLAPRILKWEGGFVNDPADPGGATNMGITLSTWRKVGFDKDGDGDIDVDDLRKLDRNDFIKVLKLDYWDRWRGDSILSQSVAEILTDWVWASGAWGIKIPQRILGLGQDGVVGSKTIKAVNAQSGPTFHQQIYDARLKFIADIVKNNVAQFELHLGRPATPVELKTYTFIRFEQGWINRLNDFHFVS